MKKIILIILALSLLMPVMPVEAVVKKATVVKKTVVAKPKLTAKTKMLGRFLVETQSFDRLWYASQKDQKRYLIKEDADLKWLISKFGVVIGTKDLNKIPATPKQKATASVVTKYKGKIVLAVKDGDAWFVNPGDGFRYKLEDFNSFSQVMRVIGLEVNDASLRQLAMNSEQLVFDPTFTGEAYVRYDGNNFYNGLNNKTVLPLASLSKLMTALVLSDLNLDFEKWVTTTKEQMNYPRLTAGSGNTSEVSLLAGDRVRIEDLWVSMLLASSNQSAVILADNSGLSRAEFVARMNQKAKDLGLKKTKFYEMTGLSPYNVSTPEEMAIIASTAFKNQKISDASVKGNYVFEVADSNGGPRLVKIINSNYTLLGMQLDGAKVGYLIEAKSNVAVKKNGEIIVVMHASGLQQRNKIVQGLLDKMEYAFGQ
ncbi:MAG: serine hydrolase [bacterium]